MSHYIVNDPEYGALDKMNTNDMVSINLSLDEAFSLAMNLLSGVHSNVRQRDQRRKPGDIGDATVRNSFVARVSVKANEDVTAQPEPVAYSKRVADALTRLRKHYRSLPESKLSDEQRCINDVLWILEGEPGAKPGPFPEPEEPLRQPRGRVL